MICSFNFLIFLAVCLNISTAINIKILANSNQQTRGYKFTSIFSLCGFDHRDAWNLHTNIIWSKRSTDFKELSPCSVRYHLKLSPVFKDHRFLSCHRKCHMNWVSFKRSPVLKATFSLYQRWPCNTGLTILLKNSEILNILCIMLAGNLKK